jgi:hypothetical protein
MTNDLAVNTAHARDLADGDPDQLIGVAAAELGEWGWLAAALLDWLASAADDTVTDFGRLFAPRPTREHGIDQLHHVTERIEGLLEQDMPLDLDRCRS